MRRPVVISSLLVLVLLACGGSPPPPPSSARVATTSASAAAAVEPGPRAWVPRAGVDRALRAGLGRFLANVEVDAQLEGKRFVGWRIVALHDAPDDLWSGVDLRVGDVVTAVNGFAIERPQQADRAFQSLRVSSEIRVSLLRDGAPMELRFAIVEDGEAPPPIASATATRLAATATSASAAASAPSTAPSATTSTSTAPSATTPGKKPRQK